MSSRLLITILSKNNVLKPQAKLNKFIPASLKNFSTLDKSDDKFVTTPIFYVNAAPHIGHVYSAVLADIMSRFFGLLGKNVKFSTGTDEHGLKIQQAADIAKISPELFCTQNSNKFRDLFDLSNVKYTDYIRTTMPEHKKSVEKFWNILVENGHIYKGKFSGWYSVSDEAFYTHAQVEQVLDKSNNISYTVSLETGSKVEWTEEENYMFRLSSFKDKLLEMVETNKEFITPENRRNEVINWLKQDLQDLSVSRPRTRLSWGIPVPNDSSQTIYVWVDALINYLSIDGFYKPDYLSGQFFPPTIQVVGKDILKFHAIYWPALLLAADLPLPQHIIAHAHWTMDNFKMSKSRGNVADPYSAIQKFGVDGLRYFLARDGGLSVDGDYSESYIKTRYNSELADHLGNLLSRCLSTKLGADTSTFLQVVKNISMFTDKKDIEIKTNLENLPENVKSLYATMDYKGALKLVNETLKLANKYFSDNKPWELNKNKDYDRLNTVVFYSLETVRIVSIMLYPIIPTKATEILDILGIPENKRDWESTKFGTSWTEFLADNNESSNSNKNVIKRNISPVFNKMQ
ncbi:hypothetical protein BB559_002728 [Furculomyces boomerangus]|uniref:Probable methionine--tRNA ligase, mitochondrial n=2 Tax=Harpellales TaxID=61421 RepID=A0A2T9YSV8_9FUNG|nr:hypothetical protein BB559_002728 [Furculomyces boomerangus]PVZ96738.1 hypothetical protein BB558_007337 [Smittium angustum]